MKKNPFRLTRYFHTGWVPGGRRFCVMCSQAVRSFMPYGGGSRARPALMTALHVIGSNWDDFDCPHCGAHDRERHLLMYLRASGLMDELAGLKILHFAPERRLSEKIAARTPVRYVKCDLFPTSPEIEKVDMEQMSFANGAFDLVLANHVLEHVNDLDRALFEISRVLTPGGKAILQTPYSPLLEVTWSDPGITSAEARRQAYGQEDHVRLFGRDIFDRMKMYGLVSKSLTHEALLTDQDGWKHGVNESEPFFLFEKTVKDAAV